MTLNFSSWAVTPEPSDKLWAWAYALVAGAVAGWAVALASVTAQDVGWLLVVLGVTIAARQWLANWYLRFSLRAQRRLTRQLATVTLTLCAVLVLLTPFGDLLATLWRSAPALTGGTGSMVFVVTAAVPWLVQNEMAPSLPTTIRLLVLPLRFVRLVLGRGAVPCLVVMAEPDFALLVPSLAFAGTELALELLSLWRTGNVAQRFGEISIFPGLYQRDGDKLLLAWMHDFVVTTPDRPDFTIPHLLIEAAAGLRQSHPRDPRRKHIELLHLAAERMLDLVDRHVLRGSSEANSEIARRQHLVRGLAMTNRAKAYGDEDYLEDMLAARYAAVTHFDRADCPAHAANARLNLASEMFSTFGRPDEAADLLRHVREAPGTPEFLMRHSYVLEAEQECRARRYTRARELYDKAQRFHRKRTDMDVFYREMHLTVRYFRMASTQRAVLSMLGELEVQLSRDLDEEPGRVRMSVHDIAGMGTHQVPVGRRPRTVILPPDLLAYDALARRKFRQAGRHALQALAVAQRDKNLLMMLRALDVMADLQTRGENWDALYRCLDGAISMVEARRRRVPDPDMRMEITSKAYGRMVRLLVNGGHLLATRLDAPVLAFDTAERDRSRVLLEELAGGLVLSKSFPQRVDDETAGRKRATIVEQWSRPPGSRPFSNPVYSELAQVMRETDDAMSQAMRAVSTALVGSEELSSGTPITYLEVREVLATMGAATGRRVVLAVYYGLSDGGTILFLARADLAAPRITRLELDLTAPDFTESATPAVGADAPQAWQDACTAVLHPLVENTVDGDIVWLVPYAGLHQIPLHAVEFDGRPLIERNAWFVSQSVSVMRYCMSSSTSSSAAAILADSVPTEPLPYARAEAWTVGDLLAADRRLLSADATKVGLLDLVSTTKLDVLHIACHGQFDLARPDESGIKLAPPRDGGVPETLTIADLATVRLSVNLVTLSACHSGRGRFRAGDELIGLARAFLYAGAASVLISLWNVDDASTSMLMRVFYRELSQGTARAQALRIAQLAVRQATTAQLAEHYERLLEVMPSTDPSFEEINRAAALSLIRASSPASRDQRPFAHPYYWAPFILVGDCR